MNKNINEMEILKFENFLGEIDKKIQWEIQQEYRPFFSLSGSGNLIGSRVLGGTVVNLIFFNEKMNPLIEKLCEKAYNGKIPETYDYRYELEKVNETNRYNIISEYIVGYSSAENYEKKRFKRVMLRYLFYGILGTLLVEDSKKYIELISDLVVCLNVENEEISDIVNVVKYVTDGDSFEFKSDACREVFGGIVNK